MKSIFMITIIMGIFTTGMTIIGCSVQEAQTYTSPPKIKGLKAAVVPNGVFRSNLKSSVFMWPTKRNGKAFTRDEDMKSRGSIIKLSDEMEDIEVKVLALYERLASLDPQAPDFDVRAEELEAEVDGLQGEEILPRLEKLFLLVDETYTEDRGYEQVNYFGTLGSGSFRITVKSKDKVDVKITGFPKGFGNEAFDEFFESSAADERFKVYDTSYDYEDGFVTFRLPYLSQTLNDWHIRGHYLFKLELTQLEGFKRYSGTVKRVDQFGNERSGRVTLDGEITVD